jgi:GT2 family glycosyltransferase
VIRDIAAAKRDLLAEFTAERENREEFRTKQLLPALERLQERERALVEIEDVTEYGASAPNPAVSVIVTLYRRIDYLEHQLVQFARDPEMQEVDLVYVLDSPELASRLAELAPALHELHGVPFRVVRLTRNSGYATANNLGASLARGRLLLFLNSDVLPDEPGWLEEMVNFYEATPDIGALGPKLVFEDESIQHAGMYFGRDESGLWGNLHYFKGFVHRDFPEASVSRPVPAVTGACLMTEATLFAEVGGFSHMYLRGGYEDSDICLRLAAMGRRNWYVGDVELYHLEGQVHPTPASAATVMFATWLQTHLWGGLIEELMSKQDVEESFERSG